MTNNYHTPIPEGSPADAATFNNPMAEFDQALTDALLTEKDGHIIQDEGVDLPQQARLNFAGAGVTVTNETGKTLVTIPGGGVTDHGALSGLGDDDHPQYELKTGVASKLDTIYKGLGLIWNSGTSLSLAVGACYAENGDYINVTSPLTASSLSLSNSTWYHGYVYLSGGSPAMEVVTTAPVLWKGLAHSKTGDTSRRYMFSVKTNASGNVYRVIHDPITNIVFYLNNDLGSSPFRVLSNGMEVAATSVSLSGVVPVTGMLAYGRLSNSDASQYVNIGIATLTTSVFDIFVSGAQRLMSFFAVDTGLVTYYIYGGSPSSGLYIDVIGYTFKR